MPIKTASPLVMTSEQRAQLKVMARSSSLPARKVVQARSLLWAADGVSNRDNARRCGTTRETVIGWRKRFEEQGVDGVGVIAPGRGRKARLPDGTVAEVVRVTQQETPADTSTHWSTRSLGKRFGIGKDTVARIWRDHELKPWKVDTFKISNDPRFEEKCTDVVALYMNPPERAVVFSFDEKTQCQHPVGEFQQPVTAVRDLHFGIGPDTAASTASRTPLNRRKGFRETAARRRTCTHTILFSESTSPV